MALPESATATVDGGHALKTPGSGAPPETAPETVYDHGSVLEMPALTDVPAAKDEGEQPGGADGLRAAIGVADTVVRGTAGGGR